MPLLKTMPSDAGPPTIYVKYPEIYGPWSTMSQELMNGPSPLSKGERELIFSYSAALAGASYIYAAHSEVAYAWGIEKDLIVRLLEDPEAAPVEPRLRPVLAFVRKLTVAPGELSQEDADAIFEQGWDEQALHDAIAISGRAAFMQRLTQGYGFEPMSREEAAKRAKKRLEHGYVNLYPTFRKDK